MLPVPFEVVPSAVNTLLPAFLQFLKAAGEYLFRNVCELHRRSRLNNLDIRLHKSSRLIDKEGISQHAHCNSTVFPYHVSDANHVFFFP